MRGIKEIAKEMTKEEFKKRYYHRCLRDLDKEFKCNEKCDKHLEHFMQQIEDITFKDEELTAICINDKTERDKRIKMLGITEGKEYPVKLCRYPNYFELVNDQGNVETYFMDRFEIKTSLEESISHVVKSISEMSKTWMQKAMERVEPIVKEKLQEAIKNYFEGDKMEDKTIKVRCINTNEFRFLTLNKIYETRKLGDKLTYIEDDTGEVQAYQSELFEKVEEVLMVKCIDNKDYKDKLELNKAYKVKKEFDKSYSLEGMPQDYQFAKKRFKPVEPQKEVKEYSVMELLDFPVGTEFQNIESKCYVKIVEIEGIKSITTINKENNHHVWDKEMVAPLNEVWKI